MELNILREIIEIKNDTPIDILNYIIMLNSFLNVYIVYRIMLTIHIIVEFVEKIQN